MTKGMAGAEDAIWLQKMLNLEGEQTGTGTRMDNEKVLWVEW